MVHESLSSVPFVEENFRRGAVAQLAPSRPKAGHVTCECKAGVSTLAECACVENTLDTTWVIFNAAGKPPPARA
ncbi:hypothetical protein E4T56_gene17404 [Termitomyces sp. T112]|nr:hypothetical protein E4T56_gene17404 [Termitomyces sp. T112]